MSKQNRIWMGVAALLLVAIYFVPIWSINLNAPQYPGGIGMNIWVDTIAGKAPHDLQNINGLNHYIGMKKIEPDSIAELQIMPYLFAFMIITGLIVAIRGNRKWVLIWLGTFVLLALVGLADFYLWEYDYGHNLNPDAAIKIPGMNYQPPLLGTKQLLNMRTTSLPHIGFFVALISMGMAAWIWWKESRDKTEEKEELSWGSKIAA